jgi:hypothetical protein
LVIVLINTFLKSSKYGNNGFLLKSVNSKFSIYIRTSGLQAVRVFKGVEIGVVVEGRERKEREERLGWVVGGGCCLGGW